MNNQRHVSLTITARAPGTPQHQAASECDLNAQADALGIRTPEPDAGYQHRPDHTPLRTKLRPITAHLHATNQITASARQDANGAHWRMTIMK